MRVALVSDLHFEFHRDYGDAIVASLDPTGVDVLVLAGDIAVGARLPEALGKLCQRYAKAKVLLVLGNHEYYQTSPEAMEDVCHQARVENPNLEILDNRVVDIQGVRFAGTSLWFRDDPLNAKYKDGLTDFGVIRNFVPWVYQQNQMSEQFIRTVLKSERPPDVVVTHHLPSERCVAERYKGDNLNRFFVAPIADSLPKLPRYWFYGHTHTALDEEWDGCRFATNPKGYPNEAKWSTFRKDLTFTIEPVVPLK